MDDTKKKKVQVEKQDKPDIIPTSQTLNKLQIQKKFKANDKQDVDPQYDSDEEKEMTMEFGKEIKNAKDLKGLDLAFCIDTTGSMTAFMKSIKELMRKIIRDGQNFVNEYQKTKDLFKVGIVAYRDHDDEKQKDSYLTKKLDFTDGVSAKNFINSLSAKGGYDKAEAVIDGLKEIVNLKWRDNSEKFLIHFLDGPPHGQDYGSDSRFSGGCPCKTDEEDVFYPFRDLNVKYTIIKLNNDIDIMIKKFTEIFELEVFKLEGVKYDQNEKNTQYY